MTNAHNMLRSYFSRWENLEQQKAEIQEDLKSLFAGAKSNGMDTKAMRAAFRLVAMSGEEKDAAEEQRAIVDLYVDSLTGSYAHARDAREGRPSRNEPEAAAEVAGDCLREPAAAEQGQTIQEGDAPREGHDAEARKSAHLDTEYEPDQTSKSTAVHNGAGKTGVTVGETTPNRDTIPSLTMPERFDEPELPAHLDRRAS